MRKNLKIQAYNLGNFSPAGEPVTDSATRPLKVFICHASADKPAVRNLHRYLYLRGVSPWLDELSLLPGEDWRAEIEKAIFASDVILVCLSKNSINKEGYVQSEITFALDKAMEKPEGTIFIIPARLEECEVPFRLRKFHWVDLFREGGNNRLMMSLNKRAAQLGPNILLGRVATDLKSDLRKSLEPTSAKVDQAGDVSNSVKLPTGKSDETREIASFLKQDLAKTEKKSEVETTYSEPYGERNRIFGLKRKRVTIVILTLAMIFLVTLGIRYAAIRLAVPTAVGTPENPQVRVTILNNNIETAVLRVNGTNQADSLDQNVLGVSSCAINQSISVWAPGYYVKTIPCDGSTTYNVQLDELEKDNVHYSWETAQNCADCHSELQGRTEQFEWIQDSHSRVFVDPYFWTIYMGTNVYRKPSDYQYGPGYRLDFPTKNGNCAYCHLPATVSGSPPEVDLTPIINSELGSHGDVTTEGLTCDLCHKVVDVLIDEATQLPNPDKPGLLSFSFARPELGQLFFTGPLADQAAQPLEVKTTCSPVFSESEFCAACHYGKFFDTVIYNSYGEWLDSEYSKEENKNYRSCQDCHMQSAQEVGNTLPQERAACSETNHSFRNFNHNMMGRDSNNVPSLVKNAARIDLTAKIEGGRIKVSVEVLSMGVGHKFPTDAPMRHLILLVEARDRNGTLLAQLDGPIIPLWGGTGGQPEDHAGSPGEIYANILQDEATGIAPTVAYWKPTLPAWVGSDTRLKPGEPVSREYSFALPSNGSASISAKLIYRYGFIDIQRQKGWPIKNEMLVTAALIPVP